MPGAAETVGDDAPDDVAALKLPVAADGLLATADRAEDAAPWVADGCTGAADAGEDGVAGAGAAWMGLVAAAPVMEPFAIDVADADVDTRPVAGVEAAEAATVAIDAGDAAEDGASPAVIVPLPSDSTITSGLTCASARAGSRSPVDRGPMTPSSQPSLQPK